MCFSLTLEAEEDESYELLNSLSVSIPFIVIVDALLVAAYLWIIGKEVKFPQFEISTHFSSLCHKKTLPYLCRRLKLGRCPRQMGMRRQIKLRFCHNVLRLLI